MNNMCKNKGSVDANVICMKNMVGVVTENWKDYILISPVKQGM